MTINMSSARRWICLLTTVKNSKLIKNVFEWVRDIKIKNIRANNFAYLLYFI